MKYMVKITSVEKITSQIVVIVNDTLLEFKSGKELSEYEFDRNYLIDNIYIRDDKLAVELKENKSINQMNWVGDEQVVFF